MKKPEPFPKRTYGSMRELFADTFAILSNVSLVRTAMRGNLVSAELRERLMLVVTQVNDCRYCKRFHTSEALRIGISADDINLIILGDIPDNLPPTEETALQYARHWSESNAQPLDAEFHRLIESYGQETSDVIHVLLHMIRIGNLTGNTLDSWLYRFSSGKWGLPVSRSE